MSRTRNALKNVVFGVIAKILTLLFAFFVRTIFIYFLGNTYLGVNGLYSEILLLLSITELGFGTAMAFSMYKPVADNDSETIIRLLDFYKKVFRVVAAVIAVSGLSLLPFLGNIVKGADWLSVTELQVYFLIYLFNTVVGYFVTYKYTYINALQKNYITTNIDTICSIVSYLVQIIVIIFFKSFLLYLLSTSSVLLLSKVFIVIYLNNKYPILKERPSIPLSKEEKASIYKEVRGLAILNVSGVAVHATDNLLISTLTTFGVVTIGYISNYNMLMNSVLGFVTILFGSVTSGFGNLVASSTIENFRQVFKEMNFASFWIYGFCSIAFWILIPPFITLWIGSDKLVDDVSFALLIINCYLQGQSTVYNNARNSKGHFGIDKWCGVAVAATNLIVSVICARYFDLVGIYIGTITSRVVGIILRPLLSYRYVFNSSSSEYYKTQFLYFSITVFAAVMTKFLAAPILKEVSVVRFIICTIVVVFVPNCIFLISSFKSMEFALWKKRLKYILNRTNVPEE